MIFAVFSAVTFASARLMSTLIQAKSAAIALGSKCVCAQVALSVATVTLPA